VEPVELAQGLGDPARARLGITNLSRGNRSNTPLMIMNHSTRCPKNGVSITHRTWLTGYFP
jgi:hypothetical protein